MSRNAFQQIERDYIRQQEQAEIAREERRLSMNEQELIETAKKADGIFQNSSFIGRPYHYCSFARNDLPRFAALIEAPLKQRIAELEAAHAENLRQHEITLKQRDDARAECNGLQAKLDELKKQVPDGWQLNFQTL